MGGVNDSTARERCLVVVCIVRSNQCEAAPDFSVCAKMRLFYMCVVRKKTGGEKGTVLVKNQDSFSIGKPAIAHAMNPPSTLDKFVEPASRST